MVSTTFTCFSSLADCGGKTRGERREGREAVGLSTATVRLNAGGGQGGRQGALSPSARDVPGTRRGREREA
eukprot:3973589-Prymnesium_polylepis.1